MPDRHWLPSVYMDESIPPPRPSPDAWIERLDDGAFCLGSCDPFEEDATPGIKLTEGQTVEFDWTEYHGEAELVVAYDGSYKVDRPMPASPKGASMLVCIYGDTDSVSRDIGELIEDNIYELGKPMKIRYFCWSDKSEKFTFAAGKFHPQASPDA